LVQQLDSFLLCYWFLTCLMVKFFFFVGNLKNLHFFIFVIRHQGFYWRRSSIYHYFTFDYLLIIIYSAHFIIFSVIPLEFTHFC
jgi:hypothetical protein